MTKLSVNINKIATIRNARGGNNPDVIKAADWIVDLGPEAGDRGGNLVFAGTPEARRKTIQRTTAVRTPETANVPKTKAETQRSTAAARRTAV